MTAMLTGPSSVSFTRIHSSGEEPSQMLEIWVAPSGRAMPAFSAIWVVRPATSVEKSRPKARTKAPMSRQRKPLPRTMGVMRANMYGMTARSTNGTILLPGMTTAMKTTMGTRMSDTASVTGWPMATAESRPI